MAIGKTPQNQLDALPLQDADTAAAGGVLSIVGGSINRFWDPNTLQINGINTTTFSATKVALVTPYLDLRGCTKFVFALRRTVAGAAGAVPSGILTFQYRLGASDTPAVTQTGSIDDSMNGIINNTSGVIFPATAGAETDTRILTFDEFQNSGVGGAVSLSIGSDVRLIFSFSTNPVNVINFFTAYLWGAS